MDTSLFAVSQSFSAENNGKLSSAKQISDLDDAELLAIFERLSPYDRLIVSEGCRRWYELSRKAWLDVTELDLSPIPGKHVGAIVRQCPNLQSIIALRKSFGFNELTSLCRSSSLSSVKLYDCSFALASNPRVVNDVFANIFSEDLPHASWKELVLHGAHFCDITVSSTIYLLDVAVWRVSTEYNTRPKWALSCAYLPASLTRLRLSGLCFRRGVDLCSSLFLYGLPRLQSLACLSLQRAPKDTTMLGCCETDDPVGVPVPFPAIFERLCTLSNLRELCLGASWSFISLHTLRRLISRLPRLEVLFLNRVNGFAIEEDLKELMTKHSGLRILLLSGTVVRFPWDVHPIEIPPRQPFPTGFGSYPAPLLHIFLGQEASGRFRFAESSWNTAVIHRIDQPAAQFLEREDIAPIFDGVWLAEKIKETVKNDVGELWTHLS